MTKELKMGLVKMDDETIVSPLDKLFCSREQEFWFDKGYKCSQEEKSQEEEQYEDKIKVAESQIDYWKKSREIKELQLLDILKLFPKESEKYKKIWRILSNAKYFDIIMKDRSSQNVQKESKP